MIRAVVFDLGGTLLEFNPDRLPWLDWEREGVLHAHAYLLEQGHALAESEFASRFVAALDDRWQEATEGGANLRLVDVMRETCAACGIAPTDEQVLEASARYITPLDARVAAYEDAIDTLAALRERGYALGLVSNTMWPGEVHRRELDRCGLAPYLPHAVFSSDVGIWKPQPGIYQIVLDALQVAPGDAIFVGDSPEHDIVGAQRLGMRAVLKQNNTFALRDVRPDAIIGRLIDLLELVAGW